MKLHKNFSLILSTLFFILSLVFAYTSINIQSTVVIACLWVSLIWMIVYNNQDLGLSK